MRNLTKLLALTLVAALLLPSAALADEPEASGQLWMQWLNWEEDPEPEDEPHPDRPNIIPGQEHHMAFYTSEKDGDKLTPVPVEELRAGKGVTIHPLCPGVKGKEHYAALFVPEWEKEYTLSYNGASITLDTRLPDLALYSKPQAAPENYLKDWNGLGYSPVREDSTAYIISTAQDGTHGRHLVELDMAADCPDKDNFTLEKVSDGVYKWTVKNGDIKAAEQHLLLNVTWQDAPFTGGAAHTEQREYVACQQASVLVCEKPVPKFDQDNPTRYHSVENEFKNKMTLKAGEARTVYLTLTYLNDEVGDWIMKGTRASFTMVSDGALKVTTDSADPMKATFRCDKPGVYTFTIDTSYPVVDALYHEDGRAYTAEEFKKWNEETLYRSENGEIAIVTDRETGEAVSFEQAFPGQKVEYHMVLDDVWHPVTVTVLDNTPVSFPDVPESAWYAPAVDFVSGRGYMNGDAGGRFMPGGKITGGEFAQILYNKEGRPAAAAGAAFQGVRAQWYAPAVLWCAGEGIVTDKGEAAVDPEKPLSREQIALMLYNAAGKPAGSADLSGFGDAGQISAWAKAAMEWAVSAKVLQGSGGKLNPTGTATRAEVAQVLMNHFA